MPNKKNSRKAGERNKKSKEDEKSINSENIQNIEIQADNETSKENENINEINDLKNGNKDVGNEDNKKNEDVENNERNSNGTNSDNEKVKNNDEKNTDNEDQKNDTHNENSKESVIEKNEDDELKASDYDIFFEDDILCRICYDDSSGEPLIVPCTCKGTMAFVHKTCLERWLAESNSSACELCHYRYNTQRATKYKVCEAICKWLRYSDEDYDFPGRNVRTDIVVCCMLTPFAFIGSGLCILTADYYSHERFSKIPAARWTSISLLFMIGIVVIGYYLWVYMVVRYHGQMWYAWWQRDSIVKVIIADVNRVP